MRKANIVSMFASSIVFAAVSVSATSAAAQERAPDADVQHSRIDEDAGRGVALGFENGLFGHAYEQGVRVRVPVLRHFSIDLRGLSALANIGDGGGDPTWRAGGGVQIIGHSPVYLSLVRLYGGGGADVLTRVSGPASDKTVVGGAGHFGFEFFFNPRLSFYAEIGGRSGDELTAGGTAIAGMMLYPFAGR